MIILSYYQVRPLLNALAAGMDSAQCSPDLGRTTTTVTLADVGIDFPDGSRINWEDARRIDAHENQCFQVEGDQVTLVQIFSEATQWVRTLYPTASAPTTIVAGFPMHRILGIDPLRDTALKIATIAPCNGQVLDTATGLGYTAIAAARTAEHVMTIDCDPGAIAIARLNPWSRELFDSARITIQIADIVEAITTFKDGQFTRVIHDPPTMQLAGDLYSRAFYRQLRRVLSPKGKLFHYIGDLAGGSAARVATGVIRRLGEAGFRRVVRQPAAFGLVASD